MKEALIAGQIDILIPLAQLVPEHPSLLPIVADILENFDPMLFHTDLKDEVPFLIPNERRKSN